MTAAISVQSAELFEAVDALASSIFDEISDRVAASGSPSNVLAAAAPQRVEFDTPAGKRSADLSQQLAIMNGSGEEIVVISRVKEAKEILASPAAVPKGPRSSFALPEWVRPLEGKALPFDEDGALSQIRSMMVEQKRERNRHAFPAIGESKTNGGPIDQADHPLGAETFKEEEAATPSLAQEWRVFVKDLLREFPAQLGIAGLVLFVGLAILADWKLLGVLIISALILGLGLAIYLLIELIQDLCERSFPTAAVQWLAGLARRLEPSVHKVLDRAKGRKAVSDWFPRRS